LRKTYISTLLKSHITKYTDILSINRGRGYWENGFTIFPIPPPHLLRRHICNKFIIENLAYPMEVEYV
jgi:hypothetical protein